MRMAILSNASESFSYSYFYIYIADAAHIDLPIIDKEIFHWAHWIGNNLVTYTRMSNNAWARKSST